MSVGLDLEAKRREVGDDRGDVAEQGGAWRDAAGRRPDARHVEETAVFLGRADVGPESEWHRIRCCTGPAWRGVALA